MKMEIVLYDLFFDPGYKAKCKKSYGGKGFCH